VSKATLYPYIIVLRNRRSLYINIMGFLLSTGSAVLFLLEMLARRLVIVPYLAGVIFIAGLLLWNGYRHFIRHKPVFYSKALLIAGLVWMRMPYFEWLIFVFAALAFLEYQAKLAPEIGFSTDHIVFNGLFKRKYSWSDVQNVLIKDGLLTIDFKNNKLFQKEIVSGENEASEQEFNSWASVQLHAN
jgi:hypothetical protein